MTSCAGLKPDEIVKTDIPDTTINTVSTSTGSWQSFIKQHWFAAAVSTTVCIASLAFNCWQYREHSKTQIQSQPAANIEGQTQEIALLTADNAELIREKGQPQETLRLAEERAREEIARLRAEIGQSKAERDELATVNEILISQQIKRFPKIVRIAEKALQKGNQIEFICIGRNSL